MKKPAPLKTLVLEGAGWEKAQGTNDVGNCRIRTRIKVRDHTVYFEAHQGYEGRGFVSHCFKTHDNENSFFHDLQGEQFVWTNYGILNFINTFFTLDDNEKFSLINVVNDGSVRVHDTKDALC